MPKSADSMQDNCETLCKHRMSPASMITLLLCRNGDQNMTSIARACAYSTAASTNTVEKLEGKGWVERFHNGEDRRQVFVKLTEEGSRVLGEILKKPQAPSE